MKRYFLFAIKSLLLTSAIVLSNTANASNVTDVTSIGEINPTLQAQYTETVNIAFSIDNGWIYDHMEGRYVTLHEAEAKVLPGVVVGIIIGAAGGAAAHVTSNVTSGNRTTVTGVMQAALFGGISGVYGAVAAATRGAVRVMYGTLAVGAQAVPISASSTQLTQQGPTGLVGPNAQCAATFCVVDRSRFHD
jgi:hypothetical protein